MLSGVECGTRNPLPGPHAWALTHGRSTVRAGDIDAGLHQQRYPGRGLPRVTVGGAWSGLPDGVFVVVDGFPAVVDGDRLLTYDERTNAYARALPRPARGHAEVLTPASTVDVLRAGYPVRIATGAVHVADLDERL